MSPVRWPNLFIVGAPKCGTTAMSHYLARHPEIFMTESAGMKEPFYFCSDLAVSHLPWRIRKQADYLKLFDTARPVKYWGEASTGYLVSADAVPKILSTCKDPRFLVMLRNPVDLARSMHNEHYKHYGERDNFEACWRMQDSRLAGRDLPSRFTDGFALQYGTLSKTGGQLQRIVSLVDPHHLHVVLYDDFRSDAAATYAKTLEWLELEHDGRAEFAKINPSLTYRWVGLEKGLRQVRSLRQFLGLPGGLGIHALINRFNTSKETEALSPAFRRELCDYFRDDVALQSRLLGRDLSHWLA